MDVNVDIRKISIGSDYKSSAMHYLVGQKILNGLYSIHLIKQDQGTRSIKIWIEKENEVMLWKEFNSSMPVSIEYNINF
ncbi:MAG TPA: hypothetical protein DCM40_23355 [Maribacter sp.]|nr:hypothetical protein [Maribacter sp.]